MSVPRVLFVCVRNAGRSQMAAAFAQQMGEGRVEVLSAGSDPAEEVHRVVALAMSEVGIDLSRNRPRLLEPEAVRTSDVVITMGCGDACPVFPGKRYEDWKIEDPAGKPLESVRKIREDLRERVEGLLRNLRVFPPRRRGPGGAPPGRRNAERS